MPHAQHPHTYNLENRSTQASKTGLFFLALLLMLSPIASTGPQPTSGLMQFELLALIMLVGLLRSPRGRLLSGAEWTVVAVVFLLPVCYLLPLPQGTEQLLGGRALYEMSVDLLPGTIPGHTPHTGNPPIFPPEAIAEWLGNLFRDDLKMQANEWLDRTHEALSAWLSAFLYVDGRPRPVISVVPQATLATWFALLPPLAVFLGVRASNGRQIRALMTLVLLIAAGEAAFGIQQYATGRGALSYDMPDPSRALGTFTSPEHFAGFIVMVLPAAISLYASSFVHTSENHYGEKRERVLFAKIARYRPLVYGVLTLLLVAGLIFSRSRAGIGLSILGILLCTWVFSPRIGRTSVNGVQGTLLAIAVGLSVVAGLVAVLDRFTVADPLTNERETLWAHARDGITTFFPLGSGPGTFSHVFQRFKPAELGHQSIDSAHSDYLEWLFETGLPGAAVFLALLWLFIRQWRRVLRETLWSSDRFMQIGAGLGILLLLLYGLVDSNLRLPANAIYFAFLAGIFFHTFHQQDTAPHPSAPFPYTRSPREAKNPFHD